MVIILQIIKGLMCALFVSVGIGFCIVGGLATANILSSMGWPRGWTIFISFASFIIAFGAGYFLGV